MSREPYKQYDKSEFQKLYSFHYWVSWTCPKDVFQDVRLNFLWNLKCRFLLFPHFWANLFLCIDMLSKLIRWCSSFHFESSSIVFLSWTVANHSNNSNFKACAVLISSSLLQSNKLNPKLSKHNYENVYLSTGFLFWLWCTDN